MARQARRFAMKSERLGATLFVSGTLRSHRLTQGAVRRDTVIFSIVRAEWPALRSSTFQEFNARG